MQGPIVLVMPAKVTLVDNDIREAFASIMVGLAENTAETRATRAELVQARREVHQVNMKVENVAARTHVLEKHVFGSNPPPTPPAIPLLSRTTDAEHDVDAIQGRLIALESQTAEAKQAAERAEAKSDEAKKASEETRALNEQQNRTLGIAPTKEVSDPKTGETTVRDPTIWESLGAFIASREGKKILLPILGLIFSAIAARAATRTEVRVESQPAVQVVTPTIVSAPAASSGGR